MPSQPVASSSSQFTLRALFGAVALFAVVFSVMRYGGAAVVVVLTFGSLIAAHVVGNALGTRLRDEVSDRLNPRTLQAPAPADLRKARLDHRLHERTPIGRIILVTSGGAAVVAALLGGAALYFWASAGFAGWLVGTLSSAILGGFIGFLFSSFLEMTIRAWYQAAKRQ